MLLHSLFSTIAAMALIHTGCPSADVRAIRPARRDEPVTATVTQPADVPEPKLNGVFGLFELDWATPGASVASVLGGGQGENEDDADFGGFCRIDGSWGCLTDGVPAPVLCKCTKKDDLTLWHKEEECADKAYGAQRYICAHRPMDNAAQCYPLKEQS